MSFVHELKRRNVFRVGIAYAIAAWLLLQMVDVVVPIIGAPDWVSKAILLLIAVGFPLALLFAWAFELTPEGLKFERDVDRSQSITHTTGRKLDFAIISILAVAVALFAIDKFIWSAAPDDGDTVARRSIAVLPFVNMSGDPEQVFFSDGITEEILNTLVRAEGISVASRTSSFSYRNHEQSIPVIADALGVLFVLEGSVRKAGDQLRITAQLIDAKSDRHLWSETYDRKLADVFAVQSDIANAITKAIYGELDIESSAVVKVKTLTENMTAYDLYLRGSLAHAHRESLEDLNNSIVWLEQAVELDPGFAAAWEALAAVYATIPFWDTTDQTIEEFLQMSNDAADRALQLDPGLAYAMGIKGSNLTAAPPYDQLTGNSYLEAALKADPRNTTLLNWYGMGLQISGYLEEGLALQRRCLDVDPGYSNCTFYVVMGLHALGRIEEATDFADQNLDRLTSGDATTSAFVATWLQSGNRAAAILEARAVAGLDGAPAFEIIEALENPDADHSDGLRLFDDWAAENGVNLGRYAEILAAFGAYERVDFYGIAEHWFWFSYYRNFRQSDRFRLLMREYGHYDL